MTDLSLEAVRARERNLEEEWISKYRAALLSVPQRETWDERLQRTAYKVYGSVAENAREMKTKILSSKVFARCLQLVSRRLQTAVTAQPHSSVVRGLQAITPRKRQSVGVRAHSAKKAG